MIGFILKKSLCMFTHAAVNQEAAYTRMNVVRNIFTCAMGSNTQGFDGRTFLLLQRELQKEKKLMLYPPNNIHSKHPRKNPKEKDNPSVDVPSEVNCGCVPICFIRAYNFSPCTRWTVLLLIPQGKTGSN